MLLAIAFAFFLFGFVAAAASRTHRKPSTKCSSVLRWLKCVAHEVSEPHERSIDTEKTPIATPDSERGPPNGLFTKAQVESHFEPSSWQALAYEDFKTTILAKQTSMKTFPCVYATMGFRADEHRYVFLKSDNPAEPQNVRIIAPALEAYLSTARQLGPNTSLVIVCAPSEEERSVEEYNDSFWAMLRGLRITDPKPWPEEVPESIESEKWTFCYNGEPVFPVMLTPAHSRRWSRHMSVPVIALQPKWVLDLLLSTDEKREAATVKVRKLLKDFDQIEVSPDLTSYGQPGTSEARQLCLLDENQTAKCPYSNIDR